MRGDKHPFFGSGCGNKGTEFAPNCAAKPHTHAPATGKASNCLIEQKAGSTLATPCQTLAELDFADRWSQP
jgi:hypothetical protein